MPQEVKIKKVYAAGIVNSKDQWAWQGTVIANTIAEGKKLLTAFRKESGISGRCEVIDMDGHYTNRPIGVSESTNLF
jgi:type V secretory pathway adhesin AidA